MFELKTLALAEPPIQQTWSCKTTPHRVLLAHESDRMQFDMG